MWHNIFRCVKQFIQMCDKTCPNVWQDSFTCVAWLALMCDETHSNVSNKLLRCVTYRIEIETWLIQMCDMTHLEMWHDSFWCVTSLNEICNMTYSEHTIERKQEEKTKKSKTKCGLCGVIHNESLWAGKRTKEWVYVWEKRESVQDREIKRASSRVWNFDSKPFVYSSHNARSLSGTSGSTELRVRRIDWRIRDW